MEQAYDALVRWVCAEASESAMSSELRARGVLVLSLYDVLLDFCVLDALDDLAHPPHAVGALLRNPWLSRGFKESVRPPSFLFSPHAIADCAPAGPLRLFCAHARSSWRIVSESLLLLSILLAC